MVVRTRDRARSIRVAIKGNVGSLSDKTVLHLGYVKILVVIFEYSFSDVTSGGNWVRDAWKLSVLIPFFFLNNDGLTVILFFF